MSLERRGELFYLFCQEYYPHYAIDTTVAWIEAGMSLKKRPAEGVRTKHVQPLDTWTILHGEYNGSLRLCYLPVSEEGGYWFGYDSTTQCTVPIFKATNLM